MSSPVHAETLRVRSWWRACRSGVHARPDLLLLTAALAGGCQRAAPPSQFPSAQHAIARMRASQSCSRAVTGEAKLDYFGKAGRVRGSVLYIAAAPEQVRFDVFSPFGATLSTLTSDGARFALYELANKSFLRGPALACNLRRFTRIPLPPHAFVQLLRGEAPVLVHAPAEAGIDWDAGSYRLRIRGKHRAEQEIRLVPADADWNLNWSEQRVRVLQVSVRQADVPLYRVELEGHARAATAEARVDPDGIDPPLLPSGPACQAELPRRLHFVVESGEAQDVVLATHDVSHNPPLVPSIFQQPVPAGVTVRSSLCAD
ncbi:MAG TPA: hypothetical protein VER33_14895 [Polyangiaceae bacterium]|nr:hypothetical protein [Polyangiaceae bacterium]